MSDESEMIFYSGSFTKPMDDKRRLTVPSKWRLSGDEKDNTYLAIPMKNGAIAVYPPDMVKHLRQTISKIGLSNPKRGVLVELMSHADSFGCDKQGRISISESLMKHAGLKDEALLVGAGSTFEIWNLARRDEWKEKNAIVCDESVLADLEI